MVKFSNPRLFASFDDWPCGGDRVKCEFWVEHSRRGWRVGRVTTNRFGAWCKPKYTTYGGQAAIVDGDDGKTYVLIVAAPYGFVTIKQHDLQYDAADGSCHESSQPERHKELCSLILAGKSGLMAIGQGVRS